MAFPRFISEQFIQFDLNRGDRNLEVDIPQTEQFEQPPPPARPSIPVASDREDLEDDVTIEDTDLKILSSGTLHPHHFHPGRM